MIAKIIMNVTTVSSGSGSGNDVPAERGQEVVVDERVEDDRRSTRTVRPIVRRALPPQRRAIVPGHRRGRVGDVAEPAAEPGADRAASRRSCPVRQLLAEEAGRLEDEDRDQDAEDDRLRPVRREVAVTERVDQAEHEGAEDGALEVADPAEDRRRERVQAEAEAEVPDRRVVVQDLDDTGRAGQGAGDQERDARSSG